MVKKRQYEGRHGKRPLSCSEKTKKKIKLLEIALADPNFRGNRQDARECIKKLKETVLDDIGQSSPFEELGVGGLFHPLP